MASKKTASAESSVNTTDTISTTNATNETSVVSEADKTVVRSEESSNEKTQKHVYVGPTIPGVIAKGTVLSGAVPKKYQELIDKYGYMKNLLVAPEKVADANKEISLRAGAYYEFYKKATEMKKEAK